MSDYLFKKCWSCGYNISNEHWDYSKKQCLACTMNESESMGLGRDRVMNYEIADVGLMVEQYLEKNGYDGLYQPDGCACLLKDEDGLAPCGQIQTDCMAGYKITRENADAEDLAKMDSDEHEWLVGPKKQPSTGEKVGKMDILGEGGGMEEKDCCVECESESDEGELIWMDEGFYICIDCKAMNSRRYRVPEGFYVD